MRDPQDWAEPTHNRHPAVPAFAHGVGMKPSIQVGTIRGQSKVRRHWRSRKKTFMRDIRANAALGRLHFV